ncbi:hypothetical protein, partial [Teichococcus vastitatis]|uniref:hypothetical protein n=1 Tax=Teichococcus vastitatis TaxID=2307076 RepID=UPI001EE4765C
HSGDALIKPPRKRPTSDEERNCNAREQCEFSRSLTGCLCVMANGSSTIVTAATLMLHSPEQL